MGYRGRVICDFSMLQGIASKGEGQGFLSRTVGLVHKFPHLTVCSTCSTLVVPHCFAVWLCDHFTNTRAPQILAEIGEVRRAVDVELAAAASALEREAVEDQEVGSEG